MHRRSNSLKAHTHYFERVTFLREKSCFLFKFSNLGTVYHQQNLEGSKHIKHRWGGLTNNGTQFCLPAFSLLWEGTGRGERSLGPLEVEAPEDVMDFEFENPQTESTCSPAFCREFWEGASKIEKKWLQGRSRPIEGLREAISVPLSC